MLAGPTGVGKSRAAIECALRLDGEIVNFDSIQVYRGFDIGSAKPTVEELERVPHHLYDILQPEEAFDAAHHAELAQRTIDEIRERGKLPILTGGTNFYLRAFVKGLPDLPPRDESIRARLNRTLSHERGREALMRWLHRVDPVTAERISENDTHRLVRALEVWMLLGRPISSWSPPEASDLDRMPVVMIGLTAERESLRSRIHTRVERMYSDGLVEEVRGLLSRHDRGLKPFASIGYREAVEHLLDGLPLEEAITRTKNRSWQFAKRQISWLRGERDVQNVSSESSPDATATRVCEIYRRLTHTNETT